MSAQGYADLGFAKLDLERLKRRGFPEVVYSPGKTKEQLVRILREFKKRRQTCLLTKLKKDIFDYLFAFFPSLNFSHQANLGYLLYGKTVPVGLVAVVSAGTSDIPIAEEAAVTLECMGNRVVRLYDVGVAGVHRLMRNLRILRRAKVIVVVAGMEGALASVVSGLVASPVIAVPTSCGYGANFRGISALLTMLNSCSPGIAVVNIDNGFGAGYFASLINRRLRG